MWAWLQVSMRPSNVMQNVLRQPWQRGQRSEIMEVLSRYKGVFWTVGGFSGAINLLYLAPSLYMMQVYDRVLNSFNETTLLMLSLMTLGAFAIMAWIEQVRSQVLVRLGNRVDDILAARVFTAAFERNLRGRGSAAGAAMNDLTQIRQFVTGNGLFAFFDIPWTPIYILVVYFFHPILGAFTLFGAVVSFVLAWLNERVTKQGLAEANQAAIQGSAFATSNLRNAEVIEAMGMLQRFARAGRRCRTACSTNNRKPRIAPEPSAQRSSSGGSRCSRRSWGSERCWCSSTSLRPA